MRLVTRSDFDGLASAAMLEELGIVDEILYTHPKDVQDQKIAITANDVLANVPYVSGCGLWFDHHSSEHERLPLAGQFQGASEMKPSAARVIYDFYSRDAAKAGLLEKFLPLVEAVDKADSGHYTVEDIEYPQGWMMLAFIADPRTGLGYHHHFRISNYDLMTRLPGLLRTKPIEEILELPDVGERIQVYREETEKYKLFLKAHARVEGNAVILDLRGAGDVPSGNRFIEYTLFPRQNISVRLVEGRKKEYVMISVGHSTINRTSTVDVGSLTLTYGGGGHRTVGTCQVSRANADLILREMLAVINA